MTTAFDTKMAAVVGKLLLKFGPTATLTRKTAGVHDAFGGGSAPDTSTTYSVKVSPPEAITTARARGEDMGLGNDATSKTTSMVLMETVDTSDVAVPKPDVKDDTLTVYGVEYDIVEVQEIRSGGDVAVYALGLAR